jgi:maltose/moltooligosaccharide transporter
VTAVDHFILAPTLESPLKNKPELSFWQIWNMCFGFLGIQFGFALQNANMSRIFQSLGAEIDQLPILWLAGPLTGLLVQPIVGHMSDRTWGPLGRRRPFFLAGALLASVALLFMPHVGALWVAAGMLWILDASINISMEPFRALVGDQLNEKQRPLGYSMQSFFIGIGAVIASALPWLFEYVGVSNTAESANGIPDTVRYAFYCGAAVFFGAVLYTVLTTKEFPPESLYEHIHNRPAQDLSRVELRTYAAWWIAAGILILGLVWYAKEDKQLYILGAGLALFGLMKALISKHGKGMLSSIMVDLHTMPTAMRQLAWVQFFTWLALFAMWIYATPAIAESVFNSTDPRSELYNKGGNWVGVLFAFYNGFAALAALFLPILARQIGLRMTHMLCLLMGALGLASMLLIRDANWLILSMFGVGVAWAAVVSLPYVMLANDLPADKMGVYMGIFNFFIVLPQLVAATALGFFLRYFFDNKPIMAMLIGAISFTIAALLTLRVKETHHV